ncbi:MAG: hypothetical protein IJR55_02440 [Clostridia bacterium]|nr:hypothetical protein [Clostridia bacterium]
MSDKKQKSNLSRHWCQNLGAGVIVESSVDGQKRCLSAHLCGGDGAKCVKHTPSDTNTYQTQA